MSDALIFKFFFGLRCLLFFVCRQFRLCRESGRHARPDVIVHIGAPKTGTSAIQRFCLRNRLALLRAGFYYPEHHLDKNGVSGGHGFICYLNGAGAAENMADLTHWLTQADKAGLTLLLSSESFYFCAEILGPCFISRRVSVIGWYRHPVDTIVSNYNQSVKRNFSPHTLDQRCRKVLKYTDLSLYDGQCLHEWANLMGDKRCRFYPFSYSEVEPIESIFLDAIGVPAHQHARFDIDKALINRSYSPDALELKRRLNQLLTKQDVAEGAAIDLFLQHYSDSHAHPPSSYVQLIPETTLQLLNARFEQTLAQLFQRFPSLSKIMAQRDASAKPIDWTDAVAKDALIALWQQMVVHLPEVTAGLRARFQHLQSSDSRQALQDVEDILNASPAGHCADKAHPTASRS